MRKVGSILPSDRVDTGYSDPQEYQDRHRETKSASATERRTQEDSKFDQFTDELITGKPSTLKLPDYVACAARYQRQMDDLDNDQWNSELFHFVRCLKGHPQVADRSADDAFGYVSAAAEMKNGSDPWEALFGMNDSEVALEFLTVWNKIRFRPGWTPFENAASLAEAHPLYPEKCEGGKLELYRRFISIAGWLQFTMGDRNIFLPIDKTSHILMCDRSWISKLRQLAVADGFLIKVKGHVYVPGGKGKATEFRFELSLFSEFRDPAATQ
jgi:hypothetical protein